MALDPMDGPIPGENFTSDTRNYPWHRPPDHTDLNSAIESSIKHMTKRQAAFGLLTALESGVTVAQAARAFVISGVSEGKWTPDFAILLVGPVARIIQSMARGYGIKAELGLDPDSGVPTKADFDYDPDAIEMGRVPDAIKAVDTEAIQEEAATKTKRGFASRPATNDSTDSVQEDEGII